MPCGKFLPLAPLLLAPLLLAQAACNARYSMSAFHLPPDGDPERGRTAFVTLGCTSCHEVIGLDLPRPEAPAPVMLGCPVDRRMTDA